MSRDDRIDRMQRRVTRRVHRSTEPFLDRPKSVAPPARLFRPVGISTPDRSLLASIGEGSVADGISILCDAFRGGLRYVNDRRRAK